MGELTASHFAGSDDGLRDALTAADLPIEDRTECGRSFFGFEDADRPIGFGGLEIYGEAMLARTHEAGARRACLLTTTAELFFEREGSARVDRAEAPPSILWTKQATSTCSTAAVLTRPPHAGG